MRLLLAILLMAAALSASVHAGVILLAPENNAHSSSNPQGFVFKVGEQPDNCSLYINGGAAKAVQGVPANVSTAIFYELLDSAYNWSVSCSRAGIAIPSQPYALAIDTASPVVKLQKPLDFGKINSTGIEFAYLPSDSNLKSCSLRVR